MGAPLTFIALLLELMIGYPERLAKAIGHPVTWMGRLIDWLDTKLNREDEGAEARRRAGSIALLILLVVVGLISLIVEQTLLLLPLGFFALALVASTLLAQRSLFSHVASVADALEEGGVEAGREAVAKIVGRDTASLDETEIARAAIESLAENFSDGVVAPSFFMVLASLPGAALYKAINTADSMIGHRTERYRDFGRAAAKLDDIANFPAARLSAMLFAAGAVITKGASSRAAWHSAWRDGPKHVSSNAGYPEAAMAGALGISLGGPRSYHGTETDGAWLGDGRRDVTIADIRAALNLYSRTNGIFISLVLLVAFITSAL